MFKKYINNNGDKLNAINQVLSSLNKKKLKSLNDNDLTQHVELQIENNSFLQNENQKGLQTISNLRKKISDYENNTNILKGNIQTLKGNIQTLNGKIQTLSQDLRESNKKLQDEEVNKLNLLSQLKSQEKDYNNIYNELENIKYRDISSYIIDFFICILNDKDYDIALS